MDKYIFITNYSSNLEMLYAGFKDSGDRGYICLPDPWDKDVRNIDDKPSFYRKRISSYYSDNGDHFHFIVYGRILEWKSVSIPILLKDIFMNTTIISYFGDLISKHSISLIDVKEQCDYVCTFDEGDANKYGIFYCQEPYSGFDLNIEPIENDVCFIGRAKGRFEKIIRIFEILRNKGFTCDFYIADVDKHAQPYLDQIHYNTYLEYKEVIKHIKKSRCILEVMQDGSTSPSTRFAEALIYNKYLLTDCMISGYEFIPNIIYFDKIEDVDFSTIKKNREYDNSKWIDYFSIDHMINTISEIEKNPKTQM